VPMPLRRDALAGVRTFEGFTSGLGIARNTLTDRLRHLVEEGMLTQMDVGKRGTRLVTFLPERQLLHDGLCGIR